MKKIETMVTSFIAFDDARFETEGDCREYEAMNVHRRLAGKTAEQIAAALTYGDLDLAEALEQAGEQCKRARIKAGDYRRVPGGKKAAGNGVKVSGALPESGPADAGDEPNFVQTAIAEMEGAGT